MRRIPLLFVAFVMTTVQQSPAALILSGFGSIASGTSASTSWQAKSAQAFELTDDSVLGDLSAGQTIGIQGTMTMNAPSGNYWNDLLAIGVANPTGTLFPTNPWFSTQPFSLLGGVSAANATGAPLQTAYGSASGTTTLGVASANRTVDYILNITLANNFENGTDANNAHVHGYDLKFDINNDGIFDFTESGTLNTYEDDRLRIGFGMIQAGSRGIAELLTNNFSYNVFDETVPVTEPSTIKFDFGYTTVAMNGSNTGQTAVVPATSNGLSAYGVTVSDWTATSPTGGIQSVSGQMRALKKVDTDTHTFTVTIPGGLKISLDSLSFDYGKDGADPFPADFTVSSNFAGGTFTPDQNWTFDTTPAPNAGYSESALMTLGGAFSYIYSDSPTTITFTLLDSTDGNNNLISMYTWIDNVILTGTIIPEPSTMILAGLGLSALCLRRRK